MSRYISPQPQYFTDLGLPLTGGELFFYEPSTLILKDTYSNAALSIPNTNPIVLATNGSPVTDIWLSGVYRVRLFDENGNLQWDKDPVGGDSSDRLAYQVWAAGISYSIGDIVTGSNDRYYVSITEPNINNNPISSSVNWTETRLLRVYNANETYQIGTVVQTSDGFLWKAKAITAGSTPVIGSAFWDTVTSGYNELRSRVYANGLAGPAVIPVNQSRVLTSTAAYSLPQRSTTATWDQVVIGKIPNVTPVINCFAGDVVSIGATPGSAVDYTSFDFDINTTIVLTNDGTKWGLN